MFTYALILLKFNPNYLLIIRDRHCNIGQIDVFKQCLSLKKTKFFIYKVKKILHLRIIKFFLK